MAQLAGDAAGDIDSDVITAIHASCVAFTSVLGSLANETCLHAQRQTMSAEDVLNAVVRRPEQASHRTSTPYHITAVWWRCLPVAQDELGLGAVEGRGWPDGMHAELQRFVAEVRKQVGGGGGSSLAKRKRAAGDAGGNGSGIKVQRSLNRTAA